MPIAQTKRDVDTHIDIHVQEQTTFIDSYPHRRPKTHINEYIHKDTQDTDTHRGSTDYKKKVGSLDQTLPHTHSWESEKSREQRVSRARTQSFFPARPF